MSDTVDCRKEPEKLEKDWRHNKSCAWSAASQLWTLQETQISLGLGEKQLTPPKRPLNSWLALYHHQEGQHLQGGRTNFMLASVCYLPLYMHFWGKKNKQTNLVTIKLPNPNFSAPWHPSWELKGNKWLFLWRPHLHCITETFVRFLFKNHVNNLNVFLQGAITLRSPAAPPPLL